MSADHNHPGDADPAGDPLAILVMRARNGDEHAWAALVERYAPLIWSICREYRLGDSDAAGAGQHVWVHLAGQLDKIRDPAALPGWLAAATRRECERIRRPARPTHTTGHAADVSGDQPGEAGQLLTAEHHAALRRALAHLSPCCQQLITLLSEDPPVPYAKISAELGIPVGSIGSARRRCLDKLRRQPVIATLIDSATQTA